MTERNKFSVRVWSVHERADDAHRKWKRKLQNRVNQRARRARAQAQAQLKGPPLPLPPTKTTRTTKSRQIPRTQRWRIEDLKLNPENNSNNTSSSPSSLSSLSTATTCSTHAHTHTHTLYPISIPTPTASHYLASLLTPSPRSSHLLHLIHFNVLLALSANKTLLHSLATNIAPRTKIRVPIKCDASFRGCFTIAPKPQTSTTSADADAGQGADASVSVGVIPEALQPTRVQRERAHATWVNLLPFAEMRDTLIRWHDRFSHREFARDLFGTDFVGAEWFFERTCARDVPRVRRVVRREGECRRAVRVGKRRVEDKQLEDRQVEDKKLENRQVEETRVEHTNEAETRRRQRQEQEQEQEEEEEEEEAAKTARQTIHTRHGLIVWGDPHLKCSWEATEGFLQKWAWVVEGCDDMLESTNYWREKRGEDKLTFVPVDEDEDED